MWYSSESDPIGLLLYLVRLKGEPYETVTGHVIDLGGLGKGAALRTAFCTALFNSLCPPLTFTAEMLPLHRIVKLTRTLPCMLRLLAARG